MAAAFHFLFLACAVRLTARRMLFGLVVFFAFGRLFALEFLTGVTMARTMYSNQ